MKIPFLGGAYMGRSSDANAQQCVNLFFDHDQSGGRQALVGVPGLRRRVTIPTVPSTESDDYTAMVAFKDPYDAPDGITFTATTLPEPATAGAGETVAGTITGLSATSGDQYYFDEFQVGIYQVTDIYYSSTDGSTPKGYPITSADQAAGTFSTTRTVSEGIKVIRLEKRVDDAGLTITARTNSASANTATITVDGLAGYPIDQGKAQIEAGVVYYVSGDSVTYNGTTVAAGSSFTGVSGTTDFTVTSSSSVVKRCVDFYDEFYIEGATVGDNYYRVYRATYDGSETVITLRDALTLTLAGGSADKCVVIRVYAEAWESNDRDWPVSYRVPRDGRGGLFNIIGYRTFLYDAALYLIACCCQDQQTEAEAIIDYILRCQYPLTPTGVHSTAANDGNFPFSVFTHGFVRDELVTNGDFATDSDWTKGTGWSIGSGVATKAAGTGSDLAQDSNYQYYPDFAYTVTFTVSNYSAGTITPKLGAVAGTARSANGTFTEQITPTAAAAVTFTADAACALDIDDVSVKPTNEHILAPDPYFRTGASMWVVKALLFYGEKYPTGAKAALVDNAVKRALDHLTDTYLVTDASHPQKDAYRGGLGQYDITDPYYTWHKDYTIPWCSVEHNIDAWWCLHMANAQGIGSDSAHIWSTLADNLEAKLIADQASDGFWMDTKKRCAQGITGRYCTEVDASGANVIYTFTGDLTALFKTNYVFTTDDFAASNNEGERTVKSDSALSSTTVTSGNINDDQYYIIDGGNITYDSVIYGDNTNGGAGAVSATFAGRNSVTTFATQSGSSAPTVYNYETLVTTTATTGTTVAHNDGDASVSAVGVGYYLDEAAALDVSSWYIPFCIASGNLQQAKDAAPFVLEYYVTDRTRPTIQGYKPYLAQIPDTELYTNETVNTTGGMEPWSTLGYPNSLDSVWYEGTGGVLLAWLALAAQGGVNAHTYYTYYEDDFWAAIGGRTSDGWLYTEIPQETYEMQAWPSLASTATMLIAQRPNNFWEVNPAIFNAGRSQTRQVRGTYVMNDILYAVVGNSVFKWDTDYEVALVSTTVMATETGPVTMAGDGTYLMINDGTDGVAYIWDEGDDTWTRLTTAAHSFYGGGSVTFLDGRFISAAVNSDKVYYSALTSDTSLPPDGTSAWSLTQRTSVEAKTGDIVRVFTDHRELWVFKEHSTEVFFTTTDANAPYARRPGGALEHGCLAAHSVAALDNTIYWLCDDGTVRRAAGLTPEIVSAPQVAYQMGQYPGRSDAEAVAYVHEGRSWYYLSFPSAPDGGLTWLYEVSTGLWTQRKSYQTGTDWPGRWRGRGHTRFQEQDIVGDYEWGRLLLIDPDIHEDDGELLRWHRQAPAQYEDEGDPYVYSLEVEFEGGVDLVGDAAEVSLKWSHDGGHTYTCERTTDIGSHGNYGSSALFYRLGQSSRTVYRIAGADPVKTIIMGARVQAGRGRLARRIRPVGRKR